MTGRLRPSFPFAWYGVTFGATTGNKASDIITVSDPRIEVAAKTVNVTIRETTATWNHDNDGDTDEVAKSLILSKYSNNPEALKTYYLDNQGIPVVLNASYYSASHVLFKTYDLILDEINDPETLQAIRGKDITIKASAKKADTNSKNPWEDEYVNTPTDAIIQLVAADGTLNGFVANNTASEAGITFRVPASFSSANGGDRIAKIAVRVDGDEALTSDSSDDASAQNLTVGNKDASFYVSVSAPGDN